MKYILSTLLFVSLGSSCELKEFIQDLKKYQENSKLNNENKSLINDMTEASAKSKELYDKAKKAKKNMENQIGKINE